MNNHIEKISIDERSLMRSEQHKHARQRVLTDLLEHNSFALMHHEGPFTVSVEISDNKFLMEVGDGNNLLENILIPLTPLRKIIKDYEIICESYAEVVKISDPRRVEAIDMGRRGVHNEGAEILEELLCDKVKTDFETLRKLFSLIHVLQIK
jgi:uncharacterized protein (UPF0262 family)